MGPSSSSSSSCLSSSARCSSNGLAAPTTTSSSCPSSSRTASSSFCRYSLAGNPSKSSASKPRREVAVVASSSSGGRPPMPRVLPECCAKSQQQVVLGGRPPMPRVLPDRASHRQVLGRPPMPRVLPDCTSFAAAASKTSSSSSGSSSSWFRRNWENGNMLLGFGCSLLGLTAVDRYLQYEERKTIERTMREWQRETMRQRREFEDKYRRAPALYDATVTEPYPPMKGVYALPVKLKVNDVVQVLEEGVGTGNKYCVCRAIHPDKLIVVNASATGREEQEQDVVAIGWYPSVALERIDTKKNKKQKSWWW